MKQLFAASITVLAAGLPLSVSGGEVSFQPSIEAAREVEAAADPADRRPIVLEFGAAWCGWCRKMEVDTFADKAVEAMADQFLWVKVDVDEEPELSARYRVQGLPHTFVLNGNNRIIASRPGYMSPEDFVAFLNEALLHPQPPEDLMYDLLQQLVGEQTADERRETVTKIVQQLARAEREGRAEAMQAMSDSGRDVWGVLVELLSDERLAIRAASAGTLHSIGTADLPFDPFASKEERLLQVEQWRVWLDQKPDSSADSASEDVRT